MEEGADLHYAAFQHLNPTQAGPSAVSHWSSCLVIFLFMLLSVGWYLCLFVCLQKQSEDTVTYSSIMQLSGGKDQNRRRPAGRPADPNDMYSTVQKNNNIQN